MSQKSWLSLTLLLTIALIGSVLLLPPWSPLSITSSAKSQPTVGAPVLPTPTVAATKGVIPSPSGIPMAVSQAGEDRPGTTPAPNPPNIKSTSPSSISGDGPPTFLPESSPLPVTESLPVPTEAPPPQAINTVEPAESGSPAKSADTAEATPVPPVGDLTDIDELIRATEDPIWKTRWDAVNALGKLKDPRGVPALAQRALLDDNSHPRWRSLWALSSVDRAGADAIPLFRAALESSNPVEVRNAAVGLAYFQQEEAIPELLNGLRDSDPWRRWESVFSLKNVGSPQVVQALVPSLDPKVEPNTRTRQETALTLGKIGNEEVVPALLTALKQDASPEVRWRAAAALYRLGFPSALDGLEQALLAEQDGHVRKNIEQAIAKLEGG